MLMTVMDYDHAHCSSPRINHVQHHHPTARLHAFIGFAVMRGVHSIGHLVCLCLYMYETKVMACFGFFLLSFCTHEST
jgi:hypothetical protein